MRTDGRPSGRSRGRPREYNSETALEAAMQLFWTQGFTGTSLDDLARATGMNRPSLYNAFGNKKAIYRQAFNRFVERMNNEAAAQLQKRTEISDALLHFYYSALDVYYDAPEPQGCFVFCTAAPEARTHPEIRADLYTVVQQLDSIFEQRFRLAMEAGQLPTNARPKTLAAICQALLHSLAIRARAGTTKNALRKFVRESVAVLLDSENS